MGLAAGGMALGLWLLLPFLPVTPSWWGGSVGIGIGALIYFGLAYFLGLDEIKTVTRRLIRRG
jgi:hypothetical protein